MERKLQCHTAGTTERPSGAKGFRPLRLLFQGQTWRFFRMKLLAVALRLS